MLNFREKLRQKYYKLTGLTKVDAASKKQMREIIEGDKNLSIFENKFTVGKQIIDRLVENPYIDEEGLESGLQINLSTVPREVIMLKSALVGVEDVVDRRKIVRICMTHDKGTYDEKDHSRFIDALEDNNIAEMIYYANKLDRYDENFPGDIVSCPFAGAGLKHFAEPGSEGDPHDIETGVSQLSTKEQDQIEYLKKHFNRLYEEEFVNPSDVQQDGTYPSDRTEEDIAFEKKRRAEENQDED